MTDITLEERRLDSLSTMIADDSSHDVLSQRTYAHAFVFRSFGFRKIHGRSYKEIAPEASKWQVFHLGPRPDIRLRHLCNIV